MTTATTDETTSPTHTKTFCSDALIVAHAMVILDRWVPVAVRPNGVILEKKVFSKTIRRYVGARSTAWVTSDEGVR